MKGCTVLHHALVQTRLATLRNVETDTETFRRALGQIGLMLLAEALRPLETKAHRVRTPLARTTGYRLRREILLVPILRAGQGLVGLSDQLIPEARLGYLGMARDEATLQPECYLEKLPPRLGRYEVMICDPMLPPAAVPWRPVNCFNNVGAASAFSHALAAPEGVRALRKVFPTKRFTSVRWMSD